MIRFAVIGFFLCVCMPAFADMHVKRPEVIVYFPGDSARAGKSRGFFTRELERMKEKVHNFTDKIGDNSLVKAAVPVVKVVTKAAAPAAERTFGRQAEAVRETVDNLGEKISEAAELAK